MSNDLKSLERRFFEVLDAQDWNTMLSQLVSPDVKVNICGNPTMGRDQWREMGKMFYDGFPDGHHVIEDVIVDGDRAVVRARFEGTHKAAFMGIPATQKKLSLPCIMINHWKNGKVVEHHGQFDSAVLMAQLGVGPK